MAKAATRGSLPSYRRIHDEILAVRGKLENRVSTEPTIERERIIAAIRNLDVARVVLECNQTLSPTDYHPEPWRQLPKLRGRSRGRSKKR